MSQTEFLDLAAVAELADIGVDSARTYHTRAAANRRAGTPKPGDLPPPDLVIANRPAWKPATIEQWLTTRPGRGTGGGRPPGSGHSNPNGPA
ncbi:hypothetical protein [Haloactinopolyspora alba]|uniref:hypothetical protein n=1 Tax=Haloactinopolyspora alba TaxID=648780 RepID=UPI000D0CF8BA|nr:hypothetical protein [Haloactinopolyspora alba]